MQIWTLLDKLEADKGLDDNDDLGRGPIEGIAESDNNSNLEYSLYNDSDNDSSDDDSDDSLDNSPNNNLGNRSANGSAEPDYSLDLELEHSSLGDNYLGEGSAEELVELGRDSDLGSDRGLELAEQLFRLSCTFWTDVSRTGKTLHLPLYGPVSYNGLGYNPGLPEAPQGAHVRLAASSQPGYNLGQPY
ncbi:hypothetical protein V491_00487 [Pseudogymnoascus sp. VKM F-3775]|nr:hypothetical protein V491_00487 [Pseudogymnoascus sp. VKM F-3775]